MLRKFFAGIAALAFLLPHILWAASDPVVAKVEGESIRLSRLQQHAKVLGQKVTEDNYEAILGQMIEARLIASKSKDLDLQDTDSFKALQSYSFEQQLIRSYLEYLQENIGQDELEDAYQEWFAQNSEYDEVDLERISLDSREAAEEIISMLNDGESFGELASRFSQDSLASQGGSLGKVTRRGLPESIAEVVFALDEGEYTTVPISAGGKWFIFRVVGKGRAQIPSYQDVEAGLKAALAARKMKREAAALKLERSIKVYNMDGSSID